MNILQENSKYTGSASLLSECIFLLVDRDDFQRIFQIDADSRQQGRVAGGVSATHRNPYNSSTVAQMESLDRELEYIVSNIANTEASIAVVQQQLAECHTEIAVNMKTLATDDAGTSESIMEPVFAMFAKFHPNDFIRYVRAASLCLSLPPPPPPLSSSSSLSAVN
jgi:hypothetical protein